MVQSKEMLIEFGRRVFGIPGEVPMVSAQDVLEEARRYCSPSALLVASEIFGRAQAEFMVACETQE